MNETFRCVSGYDHNGDSIQVVDDNGTSVGFRSDVRVPSSPVLGTVFLSPADVRRLRKVLKKWLVKNDHI